jgi:RNA-directed DNA polymerase
LRADGHQVICTDLAVEELSLNTVRNAALIADDLVVGFQHRTEAERFLQEFRERLAKFGLELHPDKTRLIEFGRFAESNRQRRGEGKPETFTFLGFTHYCGKTRNGRFTIARRTAGKRLRAKLKDIQQTLRTRMHEPVGKVGEWLRRVVGGYYLYHAVPGNLSCLGVFRYRLCRMWRQVLRRRSQKRRWNWEGLNRLLERWLPHPRILHPYPSERFDAIHRR